jgi:hypothetical protein
MAGGTDGLVNRAKRKNVFLIMIIFELACGQGHRFEGWFASGDDFARQSDAQMVRCPVCDDAVVARVPSAKVRARAGTPAAAAPSRADTADAAPPQQAIAGLPAEIIAKLREIVRNTENVGPRFPEEARKIHYDEAPARAIRGQASKEESAELAEEGIDVATLPDFLLRETH